MRTIRFLIALLLFPILSFGNMAQPWISGSTHSTLYGAKNCRVIKENIAIDLAEDDESTFARFIIKYLIHSDVNQTIPLLFIGIGLDKNQIVFVNNIASQILDPKLINASAVKFSDTDSIAANSEDLIYFNAPLHKGENIITVAYEADLGFNTYGFVKMRTLEYSLYPSRFWKSFGTINIMMHLQSKYKIVSSNIGDPEIENDIAKWQITSINVDNIELVITEKTNFVATILLFLQPLGIAVLFLILMFFLHLKLIRKKYEQKNRSLKYALSLGIVIIPILFYVVYFSSFSLIDFSLGQESSKHGYVFLYVVTYPILVLCYGILMYGIDKNLKSKYKE